jgi:hypothetical protein
VENIVADSGPLAGGTIVTVTGGNFTTAAWVALGGKPLVDPMVVLPGTISGMTPASDAAGTVDVVVSDIGGTAVLPGGFTYEEEGSLVFLRGDANADGGVDIADAVYVLQNLFAGGDPILCSDAADANDDETVNIADAVFTLQNLFAQGEPIDPPFPDCGLDPTGHPTGGPDLPPCAYPAGTCPD